jgi:hypothetical protein
MKNLYTPIIFDFVFFGLTEGENSQRLSQDSNFGLCCVCLFELLITNSAMCRFWNRCLK